MKKACFFLVVVAIHFPKYTFSETKSEAQSQEGVKESPSDIPSLKHPAFAPDIFSTEQAQTRLYESPNKNYLIRRTRQTSDGQNKCYFLVVKGYPDQTNLGCHPNIEEKDLVSSVEESLLKKGLDPKDYQPADVPPLKHRAFAPDVFSTEQAFRRLAGYPDNGYLVRRTRQTVGGQNKCYFLVVKRSRHQAQLGCHPDILEQNLDDLIRSKLPKEISDPLLPNHCSPDPTSSPLGMLGELQGQLNPKRNISMTRRAQLSDLIQKVNEENRQHGIAFEKMSVVLDVDGTLTNNRNPDAYKEGTTLARKDALEDVKKLKELGVKIVYSSANHDFADTVLKLTKLDYIKPGECNDYTKKKDGQYEYYASGPCVSVRDTRNINDPWFRAKGKAIDFASEGKKPEVLFFADDSSGNTDVFKQYLEDEKNHPTVKRAHIYHLTPPQ